MSSIRYRRTPAIIGTGWLTQYSLAYDHAIPSRDVTKCFIVCWEERQVSEYFYVNQG